MLAIDVNDHAGSLNARGVPAFFASMLAPTGFLLVSVNPGNQPPASGAIRFIFVPELCPE